jgi:methylmalonyl-CoA epimerase
MSFHLDHLGILVHSLAESVPLYCALIGIDPGTVEYHDVPSEGVRVAMLKGNTTLELLEPTEPDGALARFLEKRGPGLHHLTYRAPAPLEDKLAELKAAGFEVLSDAPRVGAEGRVFFVHPKSCGGILTEFIEKD